MQSKTDRQTGKTKAVWSRQEKAAVAKTIDVLNHTALIETGDWSEEVEQLRDLLLCHIETNEDKVPA